MVFIGYTNVKNGIGEVTLRHFHPEDLTETEKAEGIVVDENTIPKEEPQFGKDAVLKVDIKTGVMFIEYRDRPLNIYEQTETLREENAKLQQQQAQLNADFEAFMDFIFNGGMA
jgi:hypothetical protein